MNLIGKLVEYSHQQADRFGLPKGKGAGDNDARDAFRHALISGIIILPQD